MAKRNNIIDISKYLHKKQKDNIVELIANNIKILKIMSEDIIKRVNQSILQYQQLEILLNLKHIFSNDVPIYSLVTIYNLIKKTNYPDLSLLPFSMYNSVLNKLENINIIRNKTSVEELVNLLQNLISIQEKKILITKIQLIKIRDGSKNQIHNILELVDKCHEINFIPDEYIDSQQEIIRHYQSKINKSISRIELLDF